MNYLDHIQQLESALVSAHRDKDTLSLCALYAKAGDLFLAQNQINRACFHYTHAYVFGLCSGHPETVRIHQTLCRYGREN